MTDVKVEQCDKEAAFALLVGKKVGGGDGDTYVARFPSIQEVEGAFARHRQAAEKAQQERDAVYLERRGQQIMDGSDNLSTGNMMRTIYYAEATAIRSQGHE